MLKSSLVLIALFVFNISNAQNQTFVLGTDVYTFNAVGNFQLSNIPTGAIVQVECYGGGGGGGGVWTSHYASTCTGGGGGGGYAKLNSYIVNGGTLSVTVGNGGAKGSGSSSCQCAYDGLDGGYSSASDPATATTICKAGGGKGSLHASAQNGSLFFPNKSASNPGNGGSGLIGDVLLTGNNGGSGTNPNFQTGNGGDGGDGAGPQGGAGGLFANSTVANYGVNGSPYGGGGSGTADYEGNASTFKMGGNGANGGVIITIILNPLPIEMKSFEVTQSGLVIDINWTTASEQNNDYFEIQKTKDGKTWETLQKVDGAGNSNVANSYASIDRNPYHGISYYRLKQVDINGDFKYTPIKKVNFMGDDNINIYPQPANDVVKIEWSGFNGNITLIDFSGKSVEVSIQKNGVGNYSIDVSHLSHGIYFVKLYDGATTTIKKLVVQ